MGDPGRMQATSGMAKARQSAKFFSLEIKA